MQSHGYSVTGAGTSNWGETLSGVEEPINLRWMLLYKRNLYFWKHRGRHQPTPQLTCLHWQSKHYPLRLQPPRVGEGTELAGYAATPARVTWLWSPSDGISAQAPFWDLMPTLEGICGHSGQNQVIRDDLEDIGHSRKKDALKGRNWFLWIKKVLLFLRLSHNTYLKDMYWHSINMEVLRKNIPGMHILGSQLDYVWS
jgi:hypothetical protein